jgi:hypothetical protein
MGCYSGVFLLAALFASLWLMAALRNYQHLKQISAHLKWSAKLFLSGQGYGAAELTEGSL